MHDYLFEHQSRLNHESLLGYAADIALDVPRFQRDLDTHAFAPRVREDFLSGVQSGVTDTPTFFINGLRHCKPWDLETLTAAIVAAVDQR
jgi:predicted DsbA family dithiol-disulfide isomerase